MSSEQKEQNHKNRMQKTKERVDEKIDVHTRPSHRPTEAILIVSLYSYDQWSV